MSALSIDKLRSCVRLRVPASTSNLGPGFDTLGLALRLYNEVECSWFPESGDVLTEIEGEGFARLPRGEKNLVVQAFRQVLPRKRFPYALRFKMKNRIPIGKGLGASAAARLSGVLAAAALRDFRELSIHDALARVCAMEGHPDNAVPAFHGGFCAAMLDKGRPQWLRLRIPKDIGVVVCVPEYDVPTDKARSILPAHVPLADAVHNTSRLAMLIASMERGELSYLREAMHDVLHQPYRRPLMRGMDAALTASLRAGAFGAALSGAGPAVLAFTLRGPKQAKVGREMQKAYFRAGVESRYLALDVDTHGTRIEIEP
ncbi:MAG: homoserine kinase [Elusimicrobiota bacterium]|jgi:homoserine kinase